MNDKSDKAGVDALWLEWYVTRFPGVGGPCDGHDTNMHEAYDAGYAAGLAEGRREQREEFLSAMRGESANRHDAEDCEACSVIEAYPCPVHLMQHIDALQKSLAEAQESRWQPIESAKMAREIVNLIDGTMENRRFYDTSYVVAKLAKFLDEHLLAPPEPSEVKETDAQRRARRMQEKGITEQDIADTTHYIPGGAEPD